MDYSPQQHDYINQRWNGTGQGLLATDQFQDWVSQKGTTLFCPGIPGAGKTIITATVVDELQSVFQTSPHVAIAYIYCNYRWQHRQKPIQLLGSLLGQLNQKLSFLPQQSHRVLRGNNGTSSSIKPVMQRLLSIAGIFSRVFIIIDGLDECQNLCGEWKELSTELFYLQDNGQVNLFITSRFVPEIETLFDGRSTHLEIRATDQDLQIYFDRTKPSSTALQNIDSWKDIKVAITKASNGM